MAFLSTIIGILVLLGLVLAVLASMEPPKAKVIIPILILYVIELIRLVPIK